MGKFPDAILNSGIAVDYHGNFNADIFEALVTT
jgi:hypothetical protein